MMLTPIEFMIGMLVTAGLMMGGAQLMKATPYRGMAGGVGMMVGLMIVDLYTKTQHGEAYPMWLSWIVMRTVFASILGVFACYLYRESRYREWAAAVGCVLGIGAARIFFY